MIVLIASAAAGDVKSGRHHPAVDSGVNHYRRADLYFRTGAGGGRAPYVNRFCRLPDFGRAVDYRRYHLHRGYSALRLYRVADISVPAFLAGYVMGSWYLLCAYVISGANFPRPPPAVYWRRRC